MLRHFIHFKARDPQMRLRLRSNIAPLSDRKVTRCRKRTRNAGRKRIYGITAVLVISTTAILPIIANALHTHAKTLSLDCLLA